MRSLPPALTDAVAQAFPERTVVCHGTVKVVVAAPVPTEWRDTGIVGELVVLHDPALDTVFFQVPHGLVCVCMCVFSMS